MNAAARSSPMTRAASSAQGVASARRGNRISIIGGSGGDGARRDCYYTRMPTLEVSTQTVHYVQTGGGISQALALTAPGLLEGLVLVGTGARLKVFPRLFELMAKDYAEGVAFVTGYAWSPSSPEALKE